MLGACGPMAILPSVPATRTKAPTMGTQSDPEFEVVGVSRNTGRRRVTDLLAISGIEISPNASYRPTPNIHLLISDLSFPFHQQCLLSRHDDCHRHNCDSMPSPNSILSSTITLLADSQPQAKQHLTSANSPSSWYTAILVLYKFYCFVFDNDTNGTLASAATATIWAEVYGQLQAKEWLRRHLLLCSVSRTSRYRRSRSGWNISFKYTISLIQTYCFPPLCFHHTVEPELQDAQRLQRSDSNNPRSKNTKRTLRVQRPPP
ncbi:hypothetical protein CPC08DRAFT_548325 [Agrocybe pediades]|nr:hypothetical protein CPC08DRAFT_548325 [Agrocybe pediades]